MQYPPLQECGGIFLKMCLERVKADLECDDSNVEIINCLQTYLLKLEGKSTPDIAKQLRKNIKETKIYLAKCQEELMRHPSIPKECQEWLRKFK